MAVDTKLNISIDHLSADELLELAEKLRLAGEAVKRFERAVRRARRHEGRSRSRPGWLQRKHIKLEIQVIDRRPTWPHRISMGGANR